MSDVRAWKDCPTCEGFGSLCTFPDGHTEPDNGSRSRRREANGGTACPTCQAHFAAVDGAWKEGVTLYAWWRDGVQYVGTCGRTLKEALTEGGIR